MSNVAFVGFDIYEVQLSPKNFAQNSTQLGIGKFATSKKKEPIINSGVVNKNPSLIASKYLFLPIFSASGIKIFQVYLSLIISPYCYFLDFDFVNKFVITARFTQ